MEAKPVQKREPLTPGQRRRRTRKILLIAAIIIFGSALIYMGGNYLARYVIRPRAAQKQAYEIAQLALEQGDSVAAIEALSHAGTHEALGSFFLRPRGGLGAYRDADELRYALSLTLLQAAAVGDTVYWGQYEQNGDPLDGHEAIAWRVVSREGDLVTLISLYGIDCMPYESAYLPMSWAGSSLRQWLNESFYKTAFGEAERFMIKQRRNANAANPVYGTAGSVDTNDWAYVPSIDEALLWFANDLDRVAQSTAYAKVWGANYREESCWWWLRNPGDSAYRKALVHNDGSIYYEGYTHTLASTATVRPVINLDLSRANRLTLPAARSNDGGSL